MSEANIEIVRRSFEAHQAGGIEAALHFYAPNQPFALVAEFGIDHRITRVRIYTNVDAALHAMELGE